MIAELAYPAATYSDENLDTNKIYYYVLSAVNQEGTESDFSSEFKITPLVYVNVPPTIDAVSDVQMNEDGSTAVSLTGISYGGDANSQDIQISAYTTDTNLFSNLTIDYNSPSTTGSLDLVPEANANGSSIIHITVRDNGGVENGGVDSVRVSFNVDVLAINDAPNSFTAQGEYLFNIVDGSGSFLTTEYLFITP